MKRNWLLIVLAVAAVAGTIGLLRSPWLQQMGGAGGIIGSIFPNSNRKQASGELASVRQPASAPQSPVASQRKPSSEEAPVYTPMERKPVENTNAPRPMVRPRPSEWQKPAQQEVAAARYQTDEAAPQKAIADGRVAGEQAEAPKQLQAEEERASTDAVQVRSELGARQARESEIEQRAASQSSREQAEQTKVTERPAAWAEGQPGQLRQQLLGQLNRILETRDTARGLIVNISDVLFDQGEYSLRTDAREKLAKISGIILAHPGLHLEVDGYSDSIGNAVYNLKLSEERAATVQAYFVRQGVSQDSVSVRGFGKTDPVASNDTASGRQMNRRVELVVSGDIIGVKTGVKTDPPH